jgi:hypothetical protein
MVRTNEFRGALAAAIAHVSALPEGRSLSLVLKAVQSEVEGLFVVSVVLGIIAVVFYQIARLTLALA